MKNRKKIILSFSAIILIVLFLVIYIDQKNEPVEKTPKIQETVETDDLIEASQIPRYQSTKDENELPESYLIDQPIRIDYQTGPKCGGYSTALLLRYYGEEISGPEVYDDLVKMDSGYVEPFAIKDYVDNYGGFECSLNVGTIANVKEELSSGHPVIILAYLNDNEKNFMNLHYLVATGYDKENIYLADSMPADEITDFYNRTEDYDTFLKLWDTSGDVKLKQIFLTIHKK